MALWGGGQGSNIVGRVSGRDKSYYAQQRRQKYGQYGSPWGDVPPALEDHLRSLTGVSGTALRANAGVTPLAEGQEMPLMTAGQPAEFMKLVDDGTGRQVWTGWENDPQYLAYKQQQASARSSAAKERMGPVQPVGPMTQGSGAYAQLEQLYAAHDRQAVRQGPQGEY